MKILPQTKAPDLNLNLLSREAWSLKTQAASNFTLLIVYRGFHCAICKKYLQDFQELQADFNAEGVQLLAVSADSRECAERSRDEWALDKLSIACGLTEAQMSDWGLYVSKGIDAKEPDLFAEPALFLVQPSGQVYYAAYNSMPFGRPQAEDMLKAVKFVLANHYPARGELNLLTALR